MKRYARLFILLFLVSVLLSQAAPTSAQSKTLFWDRFDVLINVDPDGTMRVTERQTITFVDGVFTFGFAIIPLDKVDNIRDISISEPNGPVYAQRTYTNDPFEFYVTDGADGREIYWYFPPTANETRTFDLVYTVDGGIRIYDEGDKLQWIAISDERDFPVLNSNVSVTLPSGAAFQIIDSAGVQAQWEQDGRSATYVAQEQIDSFDTFEIGVEFTHGVIPSVEPSWQAAHDRDEYFALNVKPILDIMVYLCAGLLFLGGPLAVYLLWYTKGRDPNVAAVPEFITEPPADIPAGLLGTLVDEQADMRDIVATIIDLARKGFLTIEEEESKGFFGTTSVDHTFINNQQDESGLDPFEREVLDSLFAGSRQKREMSALKNKFYKYLPDIQKKMYKSTVDHGYFSTSPEKVRNRWRVLGIVGIALTVLAGVLLSPLLSVTGGAVCIPFAIGLFAVSMLVMARYMPSKTRKGAEEAEKWQAFRRYLSQIERHTNLEEAGDLFEKYLPYAIAFGLNNSWVSKFSRIETTPAPIWYVPHYYPSAGRGARGLGKLSGGGSSPGRSGPGGLDGMSQSMTRGLGAMSAGLTNMLNGAGRVLSSAPSSSGSSGFSGGGGFSSGGFSGGGGGGGGGRGFG